MNRLLLLLLLAPGLAVTAQAGRRTAPGAPALPALDPSGCSPVVDNPYFPLRPGTLLVYETRAGKTTEVDSVAITRETRVVLGVGAVVVRDRTFRDSTLIRESVAWYTQDRRGSVWWLGEDVSELRDGRLLPAPRSWEAGRDSARAGIVMPAVPEVGMEYRPAYRRGVVEPVAAVHSLDAKVLVMNDAYAPCLETVEWSALGPGARERRVYAPGLGLVSRRPDATMGAWTTTRLVTRIVR